MMTINNKPSSIDDFEKLYREKFGAKPVYPNKFCQDADNITLIIEALESGEPLVSGPPEHSAS
jgi:hypothetical protein